MDKIKVVVCDDMPQVRDYFTSLLHKQSDIEVVGTAHNLETAVEIVDTTTPDIVLMDIQMETEYSGIYATKKIMESHPEIKIIIITIHLEDEFIIEAYAAGAVDYIIKTTDKEEICDSIRRVHKNNEFIRPFIARKLMDEFSKMHRQQESLMYMITVMTNLTTSEMDILKAMYFGNSRKEIANQRFTEASTIKFHVRNILRKLRYNTAKDLIGDLKKLQIFENFNNRKG